LISHFALVSVQLFTQSLRYFLSLSSTIWT